MPPKSASWMDEVGVTKPRRPSDSGRPLIPYELSTNQKPANQRSKSLSTDQIGPTRVFAPDRSGWNAIAEEAIVDDDVGAGNPDTVIDRRRSATFMPAPVSLPSWNPYQVQPRKSSFPTLTAIPSSPPMIASTGLSTMRELSSALSGIEDPVTRVARQTMDPRQVGALSSFSELKPFKKTQYVAPAPPAPVPEEKLKWDDSDYKRALDLSSENHYIPTNVSPYETVTTPYNTTFSYAIVEFKAARVDVYHFSAQTRIDVQLGCRVVVEADRGRDVGKVVYLTNDLMKAMALKKTFNKNNYEILLKRSKTARPPGWNTDNAFETFNDFNATCAMGGTPTVGGALSTDGRGPTKSLIRIAGDVEDQLMAQKAEFEEQAKRLCILAVQRHGFHQHDMEILEAEFQYDFNKLTFYFVSPKYLHFNPLVTELFKLFKTRIWMSALNPASCISPGTTKGPPSWQEGNLLPPPPSPYAANNRKYDEKRASRISNQDLQV